MNVLLKRLDQHFAQRRDKTALRDDLAQSGITYGQLDEYSGRIYGYLKEHGIGREDTVLLCLPRSLQIPVAMVGVWRAGAAFVVCEDSHASERIAFIKNDSGCTMVIDRNNLAELLSHDYLPGRETVRPHDLAYLVYTSGTTGNPKGVMLEFGNLDESCYFMQLDGVRILREDDVFAMNTPMDFVACKEFLSNALFSGATVFIVPYSCVKNPVALMELYRQAGVTCGFMTPSAFRMLRTVSPTLRWLILGGEPCANIYREDLELYNGYSMSEAGFVLALFPIDRPYHLTPIGKNRGGRVLRLLDEEGRDVPDGTPGELCYENPYVRGYRNLPERTAAAWRDGLCHSGDIAVKTASGDLVLQGRNDDMIKINGNRIEPAEIEAAVKKVTELSWACAKGFVENGKSFVALYYTDDTALDPAFLRSALAKLLPYYMIPSYYVKIDAVPLLPNGKLNRRALQAPDLNDYRSEYAAPETETEKRLCSAFSEVLELEQVGVNDDFYELGGDSLCAIRLITVMNDPLLNVSMLYQHRTVRALAKVLLQTKVEEKPAQQRDAEARRHDQPLLPMQYHLMDLQLFHPRSTFSNMPRCWRSPKGAMDREKLMGAFDAVIRNHPALESVVRFDFDSMFVLHYAPGMERNVAVEQVTEAEFEVLKEELIRPFRLLDVPLYRFRIFETECYDYIFMDFHHIFSDGTSIQVLLKNFSDAYHGRPLPHDYSYLYLSDANMRCRGEELRKARRWNETKYGGIEWCRNITPDKSSSSNHASALTAAFPVRSGALAAYCKSSRMTLNSLAIAASLLAIRAYEQKKDILVSWLFHGRDQTNWQNCVVPAIKELPVAVSFDRIRSMEELMDEVREQTGAGIRNADDPFVIRTTRDGINDSFRIRNQGVMRNISGIEGIPCEPVELVNRSNASSLANLQLLEGDDGELSLCLTYNDQRYEKSNAERFLELIRENILDLVNGTWKP